jgi:hypothetical protein
MTAATETRTSDEAKPAWAQFQNDTAELFRIAGYEVEENVLLGHKRVDVRISERRLGKVHRTAVECKYWKRALTQTDTTEIYANYLPLIPQHIDEILIITDAGVSESASAMVSGAVHLRQLTYSELLSNIFDFRHYLKKLVDQYYEDGLDRYYVPPRTTDNEELLGFVEQWLDDSTTQPLAIMGSYGLGKTTFARHLSHKYAHAALGDVSARIPILVRLGEIANEQSLEGLLGKVFTTNNFVRNYNFSTFLELNRIGRFVVIFDGFDEMKQTLSWEEFRYNLKELNRLVNGRSKVIILGRPTAFLNDEEHNFALHGTRKTAFGVRKEIDWPDYIERMVAPFDEHQVGLFLPKYVKYLVDTTDSETQRAALSAYMNYDTRGLLGGRIGDIARRPVQLKMITEILPDYHEKLEELTVHSLYDYFIGYVIERESFKQTRKRFPTPERRAFARDVAWWLWKSRERSVSEHTIPESLVEPYRGPDEPLESVVRDLVSSSVLDRRVGGRLFFPHRSLQEFLVAEAIAIGTRKKVIGPDEISAALTSQVLEFLEGFSDRAFVASLCIQVESYRGALPLGFLKLVAKQSSGTNYFPDGSLWGFLLRGIAAGSGIVSERAFIESLKQYLGRANDTTSLTCILLSALIASGRRDASAKLSARAVGYTIDRIRDLVIAEWRATLGKKKARSFSLTPLVEIIRSLNFTRQDSVIITGVYKLLRQQLRSVCYVQDWDNESLDYGRENLLERVPEWGEEVREETRRFLGLFPQEGPATRLSRRARN